MIENTNFNAILEQAGLSMYALSKRSGIPYTTINEIRNGKNDINHCSAATVCRLAAALGVTSDNILNDINYLDGVRGRYKAIDYIWSSAENSLLSFEYQGDSVTLDAGALYNIPSRIEYYNIIAAWMIKEYIEHLEWEKEAQMIIKERGLK